jgi:hypothetical protein
VFKPDERALLYLLFFAVGKVLDLASIRQGSARVEGLSHYHDVDLHTVQRSENVEGIVREHVFRVGVRW